MTIRVLIADDEPQLLAAYRDCFAAKSDAESALDDLGAALFSQSASGSDAPDFTTFSFDYVSQGEDAVRKVADAMEHGDPFSILFLDMRMPPGIDGFETARRVREIDSKVNIVVVTGYSDHNPMHIAQVAGPHDRLYYVTKPFKTIDMQQLALSLAHKWNLERALFDANALLSRQVTQLEGANVELAASEARCRHLSLHDSLTRLPNRLAFKNFIDDVLHREVRDVAVLYLDLDHFKNVNDSLGHSAGDELICQVGARLQNLLPLGAQLARLGGDEFGIALVNIGAEAALKLGQEIVDLCLQEFEILGTKVSVGGSIGVAVGKPNEVDLVEIQRRADLALYAAKRSGRSSARLFTPDLDESAQFRAKIERGLRAALKANSLTLVYQPIVIPDSGETFSYEALLRWEDAELGAVPPSVFVPVAEQCGLAKHLGDWVIRNALAECASWPDGIVSINVSTQHFHSNDLLPFIQQEAGALGLPLQRVLLEITETAMFINPEQAAKTLIELRKAGIRVALDDFGTGYSSLTNLREFEIDCIKIDRSFVSALGDDHQASAIVTSVAALARLLGLRVVAEGVESEQQVQSLRLMGCGLHQGFYYSEPLTPAELPYQSEHDGIDRGQGERAA